VRIASLSSRGNIVGRVATEPLRGVDQSRRLPRDAPIHQPSRPSLGDALTMVEPTYERSIVDRCSVAFRVVDEVMHLRSIPSSNGQPSQLRISDQHSG
jgi:hypothetical protein